MIARPLPAAAGWRWLPDGFALYRQNPGFLSLLVVCYWLTLLLLNIIPVLGALVSSMLAPVLTVGLMNACRKIERGEAVSLPTLFSGLRENTRNLFLLGALYLVCTLAMLSATALLDGGDLFSLFSAKAPFDAKRVEEANMLLPMLFLLTFMTPLLMAYWFAPLLTGWHALPVMKSLFFSFMACWINWRPFLTYGIAVFIFSGLIPGVFLAVILLLFPAAARYAMGIFLPPLILLIMPVIYASFYVTYREIFAPPSISEHA